MTKTNFLTNTLLYHNENQSQSPNLECSIRRRTTDTLVCRLKEIGDFNDFPVKGNATNSLKHDRAINVLDCKQVLKHNLCSAKK